MGHCTARRRPRVAMKVLALLSVAVAVAAANANTGCISRKAVDTSVFEAEIDVMFGRAARDVIFNVEHSEGECKYKVTNTSLNYVWSAAKLSVKDNITLSVNGEDYSFPADGSCMALPSTTKRVHIDSKPPLLLGCSQGPALYQVSSKGFGNLLVPWYNGAVLMMLTPLADTLIKIKFQNQEFVICTNGTSIAFQGDSGACSAVPAGSRILVTIPASKRSLKVEALGGEAERQIEIAGNEPLYIARKVLSGTVLVKQCFSSLAQCQAASDGQADAPATADGPTTLDSPTTSDGPASGDGDISATGDGGCSTNQGLVISLGVVVVLLVLVILAMLLARVPTKCWKEMSAAGFMMWKWRLKAHLLLTGVLPQEKVDVAYNRCDPDLQKALASTEPGEGTPMEAPHKGKDLEQLLSDIEKIVVGSSN